MPILNPSLPCPACHGELTVTEKSCPTCNIQIRGQFEGSDLDRLNQDQLHFLRIFIHCEGRIRDMEKALGISYPTVKARLAELKSAMGLALPSTPMTQAESHKESPMDVLDRLESGEVDFETALKQIRKG